MFLLANSISELLKETEQLFSETAILSPRLDAEVLLAYVLGVNRAWLVAHSDEELSTDIKNRFDTLAKRRLNREPIAYITGRKEFYGREFIVSPDVLIPRPESEMMIETLKNLPIREGMSAVDVGTGSGCLGITAKLELPTLDVTLTDISPAALAIAKQNADTLGASVKTMESDLLSNLQFPTPNFRFILANLPYVDPEWETSPETAHEPQLALYAEDNGLRLIFELLDQAPSHLVVGGYLLLEADPDQHEAIITKAKQNGLLLESVRDYIVVLKKS